MIGMLHRKKVDIGLAKFTIGIQRDQVVDFTIPFSQEPVAMVMKKQYVTSSPVYLSPFKDEVWICLLICLVLHTIALFVVIKCHLMITKQFSRNTITLKSEWPEILWIVFGLFWGQSMVGVPVYNHGTTKSDRINRTIWNNCSFRILVVSWMLFSLVLLSTYTANSAAFLMVPKLYKPIKSLEHLLSQDTYKLGVVDSGALDLAMKTSKGGTTAQLYEHSTKFAENRPPSLRKGAEIILQRPFVLLMETNTALDYVHSNCDFVLGDYFPFDSQYGFAFQENSPYLDDFNRVLLQLLEEGWVKHYYEKHKAEDKCMTGNGKVSHSKITLQQIQRMFSDFAGFLALGLCIAALLEEYTKLMQKFEQFCQWLINPLHW